MKITIAYTKDNETQHLIFDNVDPDETVLQIKDRITKKTDMPAGQQLLIGMKPLKDDSEKISEFASDVDEINLYLVTKPQNTLEDSKQQNTLADAKQIRVTMKNLSGQDIEFRCNPTDTVRSLKTQYEASTGVSVEGARTIINGRFTENEKPLSDYSISNECTIYVVSRVSNNTQRFTDNPTPPDNTTTHVNPPPPMAEEISTCSRLGFWLAVKHPKKAITVGTGAGVGVGYLALHENIGLLSLGVGAGGGLFLALVVGGLIRCAIPQGQWRTMREEESQSANLTT